MATEIPSAGYEQLRDYVQNNWGFISVLDDTGTEITRIDVAADGRASWSTGAQTRSITVTVAGSDADVTTPVTISGSELYDSDVATDVLSSDSFTGATLEKDADELTVEHEVQVPQV
jgi:hypothetical protein